MHHVYGLYKKNTKYKTNSIDENLFYIGISSSDKNFYFRMKNHKTDKCNLNKLNIIAKYDFIVRVFWNTETKQEAENREEFLINWFGRKVNKTGILTNVLSGAKDYAFIGKKQTVATRKKISKALKKINQDQNKIIANRDRNLTIPYDQVIQLIEKWAENPLETQQDFASKHNISRSKFKDWIRLYKPEYIGLTKRIQKKLFDQIIQTNKTAKNIIQEYMDLTKYDFSKAKGVYYRLINDKNQINN
jgi:hypothetical protein